MLRKQVWWLVKDRGFPAELEVSFRDGCLKGDMDVGHCAFGLWRKSPTVILNQFSFYLRNQSSDSSFRHSSTTSGPFDSRSSPTDSLRTSSPIPNRKLNSTPRNPQTPKPPTQKASPRNTQPTAPNDPEIYRPQHRVSTNPWHYSTWQSTHSASPSTSVISLLGSKAINSSTTTQSVKSPRTC